MLEIKEVREAARLIFDMDTVRFFWNDKNAVHLFYKWLSSSKGQSLVQAIEYMYRKLGIPAVAPSWVEELRSCPVDGIYLSVEHRRLAIWEEAAVEVFQSSHLGPLYIRLALQFCQFNDTVEEVVDPKWEPGLVFWDKPDFNLLMQRMMKDVCEPPENHQVDIDRIERRVSGMRITIPDDRTRLGDAYQMFSVTKPLCQLIYTWLCTRDGLSCLIELQKLHNLDMACANREVIHVKDCPYLVFLFNAGRSWARVKLTSSQIDQLEAWTATRSPDSMYVGRASVIRRSNSAYVTKVDTHIIHQLVTETKASIRNFKENSIVDHWLDHESPLASFRREVQVEFQAFISRIVLATHPLACVMRSWLLSPAGKLHNQAMVRGINQAYKEYGLNNTCRNSSFLDEVRYCLAVSDHLPPSFPEMWSKCAPAPIRALGCERSFINLVAATCSDVGEETASVSVLESCRWTASHGGYHTVKELLEPDSCENVNQVILQLLEEIYAPEYSQDVRGPNIFVPHKYLELPVVLRTSLETRFQKPTVFGCVNNSNQSLCRYFVLCGDETSDDKTWNRFVWCLEMYKSIAEIISGAYKIRPLTKRELERGREWAESPDSITFYIGDQEVGHLVHKILKETCF